MERETGIEPATSSLGSWRSTAELLPLNRVLSRARNGSAQTVLSITHLKAVEMLGNRMARVPFLRYVVEPHRFI